MATAVVQIAEVTNRLPSVPPQVVANTSNLDQRTQIPVVGNRQYRQNMAGAQNTLNTDARTFNDARQDGHLTPARNIDGRTCVDARSLDDRAVARQTDGRSVVRARQTDARHLGARQFAHNRITQTDSQQTDARLVQIIESRRRTHDRERSLSTLVKLPP